MENALSRISRKEYLMQELTVQGEILHGMCYLRLVAKNVGGRKVQYVSCKHQSVPKVKPTSAIYKFPVHYQCNALLE